MRIQTLSSRNWTLIEPVDSRGSGAVSGFLADLGANRQRDAAGIVNLFDRVAVHGPRLGASKCHQIDGEIWEFIHGRLRVLFVHDGNRLLLCTSGFMKKSQKTPPKEISRARAVIASYRSAREKATIEWLNEEGEG